MLEHSYEAPIDIDISQAAQMMKAIYGADALNIAAEHAHHLLVGGDAEGFNIWAKMMAAIRSPQ